MTHTVSYLRVPVPRGNAFALYHIGKHGGHIDLYSCIRTVSVIKAHNHTFHTHLRSQQELVDAYNRDPRHNNPANPVNRTSHCWRSDGDSSYKVNGEQIPPGGELPWYMIGIDLSDAGEYESVDEFLAAGRRLGYHLSQPYPVGGERHHVVFTQSPIPILEANNVISKNRS